MQLVRKSCLDNKNELEIQQGPLPNPHLSGDHYRPVSRVRHLYGTKGRKVYITLTPRIKSCVAIVDCAVGDCHILLLRLAFFLALV